MTDVQTSTTGDTAAYEDVLGARFFKGGPVPAGAMWARNTEYAPPTPRRTRTQKKGVMTDAQRNRQRRQQRAWYARQKADPDKWARFQTAQQRKRDAFTPEQKARYREAVRAWQARHRDPEQRATQLAHQRAWYARQKADPEKWARLQATKRRQRQQASAETKARYRESARSWAARNRERVHQYRKDYWQAKRK